ncbi:MAG TPA: FixH family protein [Verrucomicrobiae bacterium]|nr:FixH family protein [Verrucomicrobiae bacterium]
MNHSSRFNLWPVSIISFFSVAILGCATFITFCSRHPADLISPNYYEEEVRYQGQIDRQQQTQAQAPLASVSYDEAARRITLSVPATMAAARPSGQIQLYRPSAMNLDRTLKLDLTPSGSQSLDAAALLPGLWKVRVSWSVGEKRYFIDQKVIIPAS